jgi:hypothetical protein
LVANRDAGIPSPCALPVAGSSHPLHHVGPRVVQGGAVFPPGMPVLGLMRQIVRSAFGTTSGVTEGRRKPTCPNGPQSGSEADAVHVADAVAHRVSAAAMTAG